MTTRYAHGLVIGKFYPPHAGHLALVRHALARCERVTVQVLASSAESVPGALRAAWLRDELPTAHVVHGLDDAPVDYDDPAAWDAHVAVMRALLAPGARDVPPVDAVVTSDAYGEQLAHRFGAAWLRVDPGRTQTPVSGTAVRADPEGHWWALPAAVRAWFARRVVVIGAESTGTTTLAQDLTAHYGLPSVPEFGREWTALREGGLAAPWHTAEFDLVAREQARLEDDAARRTPRALVVADTDVLATAVWHERYVGTRSATVEALADARTPDLYLLTGDEIPFVQDGLRDGEHVRHAMQDRFRELLEQRRAAGGAPWVELRGSRAERLAAAVALVDALVTTPRAMSAPLPERGGDVHGAVFGEVTAPTRATLTG